MDFENIKNKKIIKNNINGMNKSREMDYICWRDWEEVIEEWVKWE